MGEWANGRGVPLGFATNGGGARAASMLAVPAREEASNMANRKHTRSLPRPFARSPARPPSAVTGALHVIEFSGTLHNAGASGFVLGRGKRYFPMKSAIYVMLAAW